MSTPLRGQVAIVTGASRGIGLATASRLAADGARVCLTARHPEQLAEAVAGLPAGSAIGVAGAADDPAHREEVVEWVASEFGGIDILVNNAGINPIYGSLMDVDPAAARKIMEVNVISTLAWTQAAVRRGLGDGPRGGSIVNLSSVSGVTPSPGIAWYGVTKAAISHLTASLAVELAPRIRVNAVAPAVVKTRFAKALYEGREEAVAATYPLGRLGTPEDVAGAIAFLVGPDASWITAQVLTLDGGLIAAGGAA